MHIRFNECITSFYMCREYLHLSEKTLNMNLHLHYFYLEIPYRLPFLIRNFADNDTV